MDNILSKSRGVKSHSKKLKKFSLSWKKAWIYGRCCSRVANFHSFQSEIYSLLEWDLFRRSEISIPFLEWGFHLPFGITSQKLPWVNVFTVFKKRWLFLLKKECTGYRNSFAKIMRKNHLRHILRETRHIPYLLILSEIFAVLQGLWQIFIECLR